VDKFEELVKRILTMRSLGLTLAEVHDSVVGVDVDESLFFFAWQATELLTGGDTHERA
jgi:hypothetical protein